MLQKVYFNVTYSIFVCSMVRPTRYFPLNILALAAPLIFFGEVAEEYGYFFQGRGVILSLVVSNDNDSMNTIKYVVYKMVKTTNQPVVS